MDMPEQPQIYLVTPPVIDLSGFPDRLAAVMDAHEIACNRIALAARDADAQGRAADALREVAHARDVAILITDHVALADRHGLDGDAFAGSVCCRTDCSDSVDSCAQTAPSGNRSA